MEQRYSFSGHESFPCKTFWLKKGYGFVVQGKNFNNPDAVIDLGVGKNLVASIRYRLWVFVICEVDEPTPLGDNLFIKADDNFSVCTLLSLLNKRLNKY